MATSPRPRRPALWAERLADVRRNSARRASSETRGTHDTGPVIYDAMTTRTQRATVRWLYLFRIFISKVEFSNATPDINRY